MMRLRKRAHEGAPGALDLGGVARRIAAAREAWLRREQAFTAALDALASGALPAPEPGEPASPLNGGASNATDTSIALGI